MASAGGSAGRGSAPGWGGSLRVRLDPTVGRPDAGDGLHGADGTVGLAPDCGYGAIGGRLVRA